MTLMQREVAPNEPLHYCLRAFRNRALNYRRSLWRRLTRELESRRWFEREPVESPQERAAMKCLETLPADQREVIVLKIWHQYTFEEIGGLLEISPNTVAGRFRYGVKKLRASLNGVARWSRPGLGRPQQPRRPVDIASDARDISPEAIRRDPP